MQSRLSTVVQREKVDVYLRYVGREPKASAAAGYSALHLREQEAFIDEALGPMPWDFERGRCHDSEIKAPTFPESVADGVVAAWHKQPGEAVARDELLVEIEADKVVMEVVGQSQVYCQLQLKQVRRLSARLYWPLTPGGAGISATTAPATATDSPVRMQAALTVPWDLLPGATRRAWTLTRRDQRYR